ncbi:MAG: motility associated factor glycosyltransferase family protein, partial [Alicyclobacillaceae bacterium]|nr:motility associated factor glycosyltransferase family protein [Alicyclobacillaceae bacterium]
LYALPTASSVAVASYPGEVVFVLQKGHEQAEEMAAALGADLFLTGGSVSTLALDLLHYFGCDPIIFAGLDLAYVDGKSHADSGTRQSVTRSYTVEVASVTGDKVLSTVSWQSFRRWIEQYISSHPDRTYINVSGGAHIQGTHLMTYGEALGRCGGNAMMYSESQNLQGSGQ